MSRSCEIRTETEVVALLAIGRRRGGRGAVRRRQARAHHGRYLIGADGARSTVRKQVGIEFEGFTYGERFMIIGTPYDFSQAGYAYRNYISDPVEWYNLFKISWKGPPGVYRLVVPVSMDEVFEDDRILETCQRKFQRFHPRSEPYEIVLYDSYVVQQRVAATFRSGRVILAGDAAHLNSPIGAMGMNSGIHDAVNLAGNMLRVLNGEEGEGALDRYVRQRRHVAVEHVQTATIANKREHGAARSGNASEIPRGGAARGRGSSAGEEVSHADVADRQRSRRSEDQLAPQESAGAVGSDADGRDPEGRPTSKIAVPAMKRANGDEKGT